MQHFDTVIRNGTILTMDPANTVINNGVIGISGELISFIGTENRDMIDVQNVINAQEGIIMPGLINGHTHAAMTMFRGLADDLPLMEWLNDHIFPAESMIDSDFVFTGTLLA